VSVQEVGELFDDLGTVVNDLSGADEFTSLVDVDLNMRVHNSSDLFSVLVDVGDDLGSQDFSDNFASFVDVNVDLDRLDSSDVTGIGVGSDVSYTTVGFMTRVTGTAVADVR
jgi:hypothetical protein